MMVKKKKAQVALEILVIFGILVIGAVIFALFYSTNIRSKVDISSNVQGSYSDIEKNLLSEDPQQPIEICGNGRCGPGENSANCPDDCGYPNSLCPTTPLNISVKMIPNEGVPAGAPGHNTFDLKVSAIRQPGYDDKEIIVKKLRIKNTMATNAIYYNNNNLPLDGVEIDSEMNISAENYFNYTISNLSSTRSGSYPFEVLVEVPGCEGLDTIGSTVVDIKGLSARLSLYPDGGNYQDENFGVNVDVFGYNSGSNISITNIFVADALGNLLNNVCSYKKERIPISGKSVDLLLDKRNNNYNYLFTNNFACYQPGEYKFIFTLHDNDENTDYDYNATIFKSIKDRCLYLRNAGEGTKSNPYIISTPGDLDCIRYNLSKYFRLGADIDLNHELLSDNSEYYWYDDIYGWNPIGTMDAPFTGSFDGAGYTIRNLYTRRNRRDYLGGGPHAVTPILFTGDIYNSLFLNVSDANFNNLNLSGVDLNGWQSGSLAYYSTNSNFKNIHVNGNIVSYYFGGGIVSYAQNSNFSDCSFDGNLNTMFFSGGLIGEAKNIIINKSTVNANIIGSYFIGGLIGNIRDFDIDNLSIINGSSSYGNISGGKITVGGLLGTGAGIIVNSHSDVDISKGYVSIGGLCGSCLSIINSYATGDINSLEITSGIYASGYLPINIGGLAGGVLGDVNNSYATGNINLISQPDSIAFRIGGLIGATSGFSKTPLSVSNSYARGNITINGVAKEIGGLIGHPMGSLKPQILNCYSTGNIAISGENSLVGGLIGGNNDANTTSSYWDTQTSGQSTSYGGLGRTTEDMTYPEYPNTYEGWDFTNVWVHDMRNTNDGYPYLMLNIVGQERGGDLIPDLEDIIASFPYIYISEDGETIDPDLINN